MTAYPRLGTGILTLAALVLARAPVAFCAQAASVTMPKQAAQRAAAASNARLDAQTTQAQGGQPSGPGRPRAGWPQGAGQAAPRQGAGGRPDVVQTGTTRSPGAPDPGARAAGAAATPAADPANTIMREVFEYSSAGRRDPFFSLMATGDLRPMLSDLRLTTILYDLSGRRPVAVMNDVSTNLQYRVTTGMMLGRMRVTRILPRKVIFAIEEFGFSRADSLVLAEKPQTRGNR
jgi:hypothetical protein